MPTINDHRFERDSKRFQLHNALVRGVTIEAGMVVSGWPSHVVRSAYYDIAKSVNRKLLNIDGTYKLGSMRKAIKDTDSRHGRGKR